MYELLIMSACFVSGFTVGGLFAVREFRKGMRGKPSALYSKSWLRRLGASAAAAMEISRQASYYKRKREEEKKEYSEDPSKSKEAHGDGWAYDGRGNRVHKLTENEKQTVQSLADEFEEQRPGDATPDQEGQPH